MSTRYVAKGRDLVSLGEDYGPMLRGTSDISWADWCSKYSPSIFSGFIFFTDNSLLFFCSWLNWISCLEFFKDFLESCPFSSSLLILRLNGFTDFQKRIFKKLVPTHFEHFLIFLVTFYQITLGIFLSLFLFIKWRRKETKKSEQIFKFKKKIHTKLWKKFK